MKKREPTEPREASANSGKTRASHNRKLRDAIERVFQITHGREMTPEERRGFGLGVRDSNHAGRQPVAKDRAQ